MRIAIGDDAAVVAPAPGKELAFSVDMLVEGRHFLPGVDPDALGHKTLAVNLSDMAAMGATPRWALLAGALPDNDERWIEAFAHGLFALAERFGVALIGGDTTRGPRNLCVTIIGELPAGAAITRSGARSGDDVYVSGTLGDAALALAATFRQDDDRCGSPRDVAATARASRAARRAGRTVARRRHRRHRCIGRTHRRSCPYPRGVGRGRRTGARADSTVARARATACGGASERDLALACLLAGGDDYELCFTAPPSARERVAAIARDLALPLTRIGVITSSRGLRVRDEHGADLAPLPAAFDHFR